MTCQTNYGVITSINEEAMAGRGRPRKFNREEALSVAMQLFWKQGYDATSFADLTEGMGISTSSLAAAFTSKEDLFLEAVDHYVMIEASETGKVLGEQKTARSAIGSVLLRAAQNMTQIEKPSSCLLMLGAINTSPANSVIIDYMVGQRRRATQRLRQRIARGISESDVPEDTDVDAVAAYYATIMRGMAIQARDGASKEELMLVANLAILSWDAIIAAHPLA